MTVRQFIAEVRGDSRLDTLDEWVASQYIHLKGINVSRLFINRDGDDRKLQRYTEIWNVINCVPMKEDELINCADVNIPGCTKVLKSCFPLPELYDTRYGSLLQISSLDWSKDFTPTDPQQYKYTKSREYQDASKRYAWLTGDRYLVIPDSFVDKVRVRGIFINKAEVDRLNDPTSCISFLDGEFVAPAKLLRNIIDATVENILKERKQIPPDVFPNENEVEKTNNKK